MAVVIETTLGDITVDLFLEQRPVTCLNFLKLCKMKYYNYNLFHTIRSGFIAQTGDPTGEGNGGESIFGVLDGPEKRFFSGEKMPKIRHTDTGLLSMVGTNDLMIGSQFFFTLGPDLDSLDGYHCVIGEVTEGHDVLRKLNEVICDETHRPYQDVRITHTVVLEDPYNDPIGFRAPSRSPSPSAERLKGGRIAPDEELDETQGKSAAEVQEMIEEKEAKARATILEIVGDIPDADIAPPENVLFVCKLNPVTTDEDLEIIFSRFGKIVSCEVIRDKKTGDSLQYAFIEFSDKKACEDAYFKMDNVLIDDRRIHVDFSQSVSKIRWLGKGRGVKHLTDMDLKRENDKNFDSSRLNQSYNKNTYRGNRNRDHTEEKDRLNSSKPKEVKDSHDRNIVRRSKDEKEPSRASYKERKESKRNERETRKDENNYSRVSHKDNKESNKRSQREESNLEPSRRGSSKDRSKTDTNYRNQHEHDSRNSEKQRSDSEREKRVQSHRDERESHREKKDHSYGEKEYKKEQDNHSRARNLRKNSPAANSRENKNKSRSSPHRSPSIKNAERIERNHLKSYDSEKNNSNKELNNANNYGKDPKPESDKYKPKHRNREKNEEIEVSKHKQKIEARTPTPTEKKKKNNKNLSNKKKVYKKCSKKDSNTKKKNDKIVKKKRKSSTSSDSDSSSESSSSSSESSSSSDSDSDTKRKRKRKYSTSSSSSSDSSTSSSSSSDSSSGTSSSSSDDDIRKKKRKVTASPKKKLSKKN